MLRIFDLGRQPRASAISGLYSLHPVWKVAMDCALAIPLALTWLDATAETISTMPDFLAAHELYGLTHYGADYADQLDGCDRHDLIQAIGNRAGTIVKLAHELEKAAYHGVAAAGGR